MSIKSLNRYIDRLSSMRNYPKELYYIGNLSLLDRPSVSIVGTRRPSNYTKNMVSLLAQELALRGVTIVSGGAMGVDAIAHLGAGSSNTVAVYPTGLDIRYPRVNSKLLSEIEANGLALSIFREGTEARKWSFVIRNEVVVALGDILIVAEADLNSGSMSSVKYALDMGKEIFVLPHRLGESEGTNRLLAEGKAKAIYSIEKFADRFGIKVDENIERDEFFYFCQSMPTLDEAVLKFGDRVYEEELEGNIEIVNGIVKLKYKID